jgi:hypothetical protein
LGDLERLGMRRWREGNGTVTVTKQKRWPRFIVVFHLFNLFNGLNRKSKRNFSLAGVKLRYWRYNPRLILSIVLLKDLNSINLSWIFVGQIVHSTNNHFIKKLTFFFLLMQQNKNKIVKIKNKYLFVKRMDGVFSF